MVRFLLALILCGSCFGQSFTVNDPAFGPSPSGAASSLITSLEAYWKLDESSGNATDSQASIVLTNTSTTYVASKINNGANFGAAGRHLSVGDLAALSFGDESFTIAAWIKANVSTSPQAWFGKWGAAGSKEYLLFSHNATEKYSFYVSNDGTATGSVQETNVITTGTWYFIVCQHDSVNNLLKIQVNNTGWTTTSFSAGVFNGTTAFRLGENADGSVPCLGGVDEVGVWRRILTDAECTTLYNSGNGLSYPF